MLFQCSARNIDITNAMDSFTLKKCFMHVKRCIYSYFGFIFFSLLYLAENLKDGLVGKGTLSSAGSYCYITHLEEVCDAPSLSSTSS